MDRLTQRMCGGWGVMPGYELNTLRGMRAVVERLAAYENTGMTPEEITALRAKQEAEQNDPLTLEELRQMDGQPVWVQSPGIPQYGRWAIVGDVFRDSLILQNDFTCHEYGRVWLAYRRPPEPGKEGLT